MAAQLGALQLVVLICLCVKQSMLIAKEDTTKFNLPLIKPAGLRWKTVR